MARKHFAFDNTGGSTPNRKYRKGKLSLRNNGESISNPLYVPAVDSDARFTIASDSNHWKGKSTSVATPIFFAANGNSTSDLIALVNNLRKEKSLSTISTVTEALVYCESQNFIVLNQNEVFPTATTNGLVMNLDIHLPASYTNGASNWYDTINPAYSASIIGNVTYYSNFGGGLNMNGSQISDYIVLPYRALDDLPSNTEWTLECWIRLDNTSGTTYFFSTATSAGGSNGYIVQKSNASVFPWNETSRSGQAITFGAGETFHMAFSVSNGISSLYKNGVKTGEYTYSMDITGAYAWVLNQEQDGTLSGFDLSQATDMGIHAIRVYNRALTATEIANNFSVHRERFGL